MAVGGVIGLWYGYTAGLSPLQRARMALMLKVLSLITIFWSFYQVETSLLICGLVLSGLPSQLLNKLLGGAFNITEENVDMLEGETMQQWAERKKKMSQEEASLRHYREQPHLLAHLSSLDRERYLDQLDDSHLRIVYGGLEELESCDEETENSEGHSDLDLDD